MSELFALDVYPFPNWHRSYSLEFLTFQSGIDLSVEQLGEEIDWGDTGEEIKIQENTETEGELSSPF